MLPIRLGCRSAGPPGDADSSLPMSRPGGRSLTRVGVVHEAEASAFIDAQLARAPFEPGRWPQIAVELGEGGTL